MRWLGVALLLLAVATPPATADEAETARRLRRIGVDEALRDDVRVAIDRGVAYLAARQRADGLWCDPGALAWQGLDGGNAVNALCALALLHADTGPARASAKRAVAKLFPADDSIAPQLSQTTYGAGIALLLLDVAGGDTERMAHIAARVSAGRDPSTGLWNGRTGPAPSLGLHAPDRAPAMSGPIHLGAAHIAVLGLDAAARRGVKIDPAVWKDVLEGLLETQQPDGSWSDDPQSATTQQTHPTATFMGAANLVLAARHLSAFSDTSRGTTRKRRVDTAVAAARSAIDADGILALWGAGLASRGVVHEPDTWGTIAGDGAVRGDSLWALEQACVLLGTERIDGTPWYADVARSLVRAQRADGSWSNLSGGVWDTGLLLTTSHVLLVLIRDAEPLRDLTPKGPPQDPALTPGGNAAPAPPAAGRGPVPVDVAAAALTRFRALLADDKTENDALLELFDLFDRAREDLAPPLDPSSPAIDPVALLRDIDAAAIDALFLAGADPAGGEEARAPVNRRAAAFLASASDATVTSVRRRAEAFSAQKKADDRPAAWTPYRPAFALLASRGGADLLGWFLSEALHDDAAGERGERSIAFLLAVPRFRDLPGAARVEAAKTIASRFAGRESAYLAQISVAPDPDPRARIRWSRQRPRVIEALLALAADAGTGAVPKGTKGRALHDVRSFSDWLRSHNDPRRPPWK